MKRFLLFLFIIIVIALSSMFYLSSYKVIIMGERYQLNSPESIHSRIKMLGKVYPQSIINLVDEKSQMTWSYKWDELAGLETKVDRTFQSLNTLFIKIKSIFGRYTNIPVVFAYSSELLESRLKSIARETDKPSKDAKLVEDGDFLRVIKHTNGLTLNIRNSMGRIRKAVGKDINLIKLSVEKAAPEVKYEDVLRQNDVNVSVASYTTHFNADNLNRVANLKIAAERMDNVIIRPGQTFSFNRFVGERTLEAGFKKAPVIINGRLVDGIAGGICQVTSTLYNSILLADLKIEKRYPHSIYDPEWAYTPPGFDAAVAYPYKDLVFTNNKPYNILIRFIFDRDKITSEIMGRERLPYEVKLVTGNVEKIPFSVIRQNSDKLSKGEEKIVQPGVDGYKAESILIRKYPGNEESCILTNDRYLKYDKIIKVGK